MLGSLGDINFTVSSNQILSYKDLNIKSGVRLTVHDSLQGKPVLEFIGESLDEINLKFNLRIENKINPMSIFENLKDKMIKGEELLFFVGEKKIGKFVISDIAQDYKRIDNLGNVLALDLDVNLKEIANKKKLNKKPVKAKNDLLENKKGAIVKALAKRNVVKKPTITDSLPLTSLGKRIWDYKKDDIKSKFKKGWCRWSLK